MGQREIVDVACTVCGCVCDDLRVTTEGGRVVQAIGACELAEPWFFAQGTRQPPVARRAGLELPLEAALEQAAELLGGSRAPLIYGLSRSSTGGQRAAVRLADWLGGTIDTTASRCHAPSVMALQQVGESTCSLGEARNRCDLVIFWGSNPTKSHPRHGERYSIDPPGMFLPRGRQDRHVVVVDVVPTATSDAADTFLQVQPGRDLEAIWTLRSLLAGQTPETGREYGADLSELKQLADRMKSCRSGVVFFGLGLTRGESGHIQVEALLRMVDDLNDHTRFYARRMRVPGDVAGADSVLCWQTGFPFSISLNRGYPRYNPGEYSANEILERGETDVCLLVGSEGIRDLTPAAIDALQQVPTIVLDYPTIDCPLVPTFSFTTAAYGIHLPGTAYRMDEIPIPLRPVLETHYPSDADVLSRLRELLPSPRLVNLRAGRDWPGAV